MPQTGWPNIFSARPAFGFEFSQQENSSFWHMLQLPQAIGNGTTTLSPTCRLSTPLATSVTTPMNSCPRMSPFFIVGTYPSTRCRSEPQIAVVVICTMASREFSIFGSGTFSTWTLFLPDQTFALIGRHLLPQLP